MSLEPRIEAIRKEYGLSQDDFWQIKQNKQWVCKHSALEIIAFKAGIEWMPPVIIEANSAGMITSMIVTGKMGDRVEWSTGETNPTNYTISGKQPAYPWAMSEKRAKDRVILKLVGIHGLVYSEDEAEDFRAPVQQEAPKPKQKSVAERKGLWAQLMDDVKAQGAKGYKYIDAYMALEDTKKLMEDLGDYKDQFREEVIAIRKLVKAGEEVSGQPVGKIMERVLPNFDNLQSDEDESNQQENTND